MSDEPQQQSPAGRQGWAPREPQDTPAGAPPDASGGTAAAGGGAGGKGGDGGADGGGDGGDGGSGQGAEGAEPGKGGGEGAGKGKKPKRPKRKGWRRIFPTWRMVLGGFILLILLVVGAFMAGYLLVDIPPANKLATKQSNVYLYSDGSQIARDGEVNREKVPLKQIPLTVQHAVLAAEDRDFYGESAVDPKAMIRAAWNTVTGKGKQSGSTITQQYVKNYYLGQEQTVSRKVKEFFISIKLDREVSKDDILEGYLNTSYFGRNAYGIQAAAQAYFGENVQDLSTAEGAYLATLLNSPNAYDVATHPENKPRAAGRWNYVLDGMVKEDWLSRGERAKATFPKPDAAKGAAGLSGQRGYVVKAVEDYLTSNDIIDEDTLAKGGYRITTTLQKDRQDAFKKAVDDQVMDKVDKDARKVDRNVRAGGASIDPATGKVVAMYGGIDYTKQYVNNATRRDYQVGSTFKPFVFTSAVQNGSVTQDGRPITPNTIYDGTNKRPVQGWSGGSYAPENEDNVDYGDISVRTATDKSVNSVYAQMAVDVGSDKVKDTAIDLGVPESTPDLNASPSIALGPSTASVLDMAEAYATLANHGKHGTYTLVEKVTRDGREIELPEQKTAQAVTREAADTTTSILQSVVQGGTGTAAQGAGRPAAGKTGTAENDTAAWFAGYTPELATVVSVMGQDPETGAHTPLYGALGEQRINGGAYPARVWAQFTKAALQGKPVKDFDLELEQGSDEPLPPTDPGTGDDGGPDTGGTTDGGTGTDGGPDTGGTTTNGGPDTGGTTDGGQQNGGRTGGQTGGQTGGPDGGTNNGGPTTDGGTDIGGPTDGGVPGGPTDGGTDTGGSPDGGTDDGGALGGITDG